MPSKKPFKGPVPKRVLQTIDIGSGNLATRLSANKTERFPDRKYLLVDPEFKVPAFTTIRENIMLTPFTAEKTLLELRNFGIRTRHINIDMPSPKQEYNFEKVFEILPSVLLPNGKVFVTTEDKKRIEEFQSLARRFGFSFAYSEIPEHEIKQKSKHGGLTPTQKIVIIDEKPIYKLELTYRLKTAYPNKETRRNWPNT